MMLRGLLCACVLLPVLASAQNTAPPQSQNLSESSGAGTSLPPLRMECMPAERASELVGQRGCVSGLLRGISVEDHHDLALSLCPDHTKCDFRAVVLAHDRKNVGELTPLRGRLIAIVGNVTHINGHPVIRVRERNQIRLAADEAPAEGDIQSPPRHRRIRYPGSNLPIPGIKRGKSW